MRKNQLVLLSFLALVAFILCMLNANRFWFRLDLTERKAYTISKVSKNLYKEIPERVTITYYLSEKLSKIHPVPSEIEDLLREYAAYSRGRIRVVVQDPVKAGTVTVAEDLGILPQQIQSVEQDQSSIATVYTGIVVEYLNKTATIPTAFSIETLEYDITTRIRSLVRGATRKVGVIVAASDKSWNTDFTYLAQALFSSGFSVQELATGSAIPDDLSCLFVFGGATELDDWDLHRIDRYIRSGGRVLFAVEGVFVDSRADLRATPIEKSDLLDMLASYGVRVEPALALDKASLALPYQTETSSGGTQMRLIRYPHWIALLERYAKSDHPLTAHFSGLDLFWPSPLAIVPVRGVSSEVLVSTTPDAWRMTKNFETNPELSAQFTAEESITKGRIPLVVALTGKFPSFFEGKPKPLRSGAENSLPDSPATATPTRLLVVGDGDFATTLIQYTRSQRNLDFLLSAADWLGGDDDLLAIRARTASVGRLDSISDPDERAHAIFGAKFVNIVLVPAAVLFFGIFRSMKRRRRAMGQKDENDDVSA